MSSASYFSMASAARPAANANCAAARRSATTTGSRCSSASRPRAAASNRANAARSPAWSWPHRPPPVRCALACARAAPVGDVTQLELLQAARQRLTTRFGQTLLLGQAREIGNGLRGLLRRLRHSRSAGRRRRRALRGDEARQHEEREARRSDSQHERADQQAAAKAFVAQATALTERLPSSAATVPAAATRPRADAAATRWPLPSRLAGVGVAAAASSTPSSSRRRSRIDAGRAVGCFARHRATNSRNAVRRLGATADRRWNFFAYARGRDVGIERRMAAHQFVQQHAERVDVVRSRSRRAVESLRARRVRRSARGLTWHRSGARCRNRRVAAGRRHRAGRWQT